jgi:hypothetical protein
MCTKRSMTARRFFSLEHHCLNLSSRFRPIKSIYILGFQGGIDQFVTPITPYSTAHEDAPLSKRIAPPKEPCRDAAKLLDGLSKSQISKASRGGAAKSLGFVHDLIVGMKNGAAVINVSGIPSPENVQESLPPDLALPICRILSSIQATDELLPAPKGLLEKEPLERFNELLQSNVFYNYTSAHLAIETDAKQSAFDHLRLYGQKLLQQGNDLLCNRRVTLKSLQKNQPTGQFSTAMS